MQVNSYVEVICKDGEKLEGILMPTKSKAYVFIKLANGYNIGIEKKRIKEIKKLREVKIKKPKLEKPKKNPKLKNILILHTGGTIASRVSYTTGGVIATFTPEDLLDMFPELKKIANIDSKLLFNIFSENMNFKYYQIIGKEIFKQAKKYDGIIVTHGTDTICYTAAALSFMLENLPIPVLLVGAQRSSDRPSSDAGMNLICAAKFIANTDFKGVAICMHETSSDEACLIMPPCKTKKLHTTRRDAFKVVNALPYARVFYKEDKIEKLSDWPAYQGEFKLLDKFENKVAILKCHPNMNAEIIKNFKGYKGLVLEGTGLGHMPIESGNEKNFKALKELINSGCVVVMTSQCVFGRIHMHVYSTGIKLNEVGVISGEDMLTETAYIKLAWLLGNFNLAEAKNLIRKNLRGEISERILYDEEFLRLE